MNDKKILNTLRDVSFLNGIAENHLAELAKLCRFVDFAENTTIFRAGESASHCFLVVNGSVSLEICGPAVGCTRILTVGEGEFLGWSSLVGETPLTATARTLSKTRAIELSGRQVLALCESNPDFGYELMRRLALAVASRLTVTRSRLLEILTAEPPTVGDSE